MLSGCAHRCCKLINTTHRNFAGECVEIHKKNSEDKNIWSYAIDTRQIGIAAMLAVLKILRIFFVVAFIC